MKRFHDFRSWLTGAALVLLACCVGCTPPVSGLPRVPQQRIAELQEKVRDLQSLIRSTEESIVWGRAAAAGNIGNGNYSRASDLAADAARDRWQAEQYRRELAAVVAELTRLGGEVPLYAPPPGANDMVFPNPMPVLPPPPGGPLVNPGVVLPHPYIPSGSNDIKIPSVPGVVLPHPFAPPGSNDIIVTPSPPPIPSWVFEATNGSR